MSKRYIEKDDAIQALKEWQATNRWDEYFEEHWEQGEDGWNAPVDVIEQLLPTYLVRCFECKYHYKDGDNVVTSHCLLNHNHVQPSDWFCADGERKETEDDEVLQ